MESQGQESQGSSTPSSTPAVSSTPSTSTDIGSAASSVADVASKLTGLDKLKADKNYVETHNKVPEKSAPAHNPDGTPVVPASYTPNFKYKAGGKEMEIPEKFRGLITDKASEEEVKKLFGQAATLEEFKGQTQELRKTLDGHTHKLNLWNRGATQLAKHAQRGDFDSFFKDMNIPAEKIYQWVLDKVNYNQLPPEQKAQLDQQRNLQRQAEMAQERMGQASQRELQLATEVKGMQLDRTLEKGDVRSMVDAFDSRVGKPGAFREAIIEHAKTVWALNQIDLTPEQAVQSFVQRFGNPTAFGAPKPPAEAGTQAAPAGTPSANAAPPVKVIPNVAGRSASPLKKPYTSLDSIRQKAKELQDRDNAGRSPSQGYIAG